MSHELPKHARSKYIEAGLLQMSIHDAVLSAVKNMKKKKIIDDVVKFWDYETVYIYKYFIDLVPMIGTYLEHELNLI